MSGKYKIIEGKIYEEVATANLEQLRIKAEQILHTIMPIQADIERLKAEIRAKENEIKVKEGKIQQYIEALKHDAELLKLAYPEKAKQLGFLT